MNTATQDNTPHHIGLLLENPLEPGSKNVAEARALAGSQGFEILCCPILNSCGGREDNPLQMNLHNELQLKSSEWRHYILGIIYKFTLLNLLDVLSADVAEVMFKKELSWALHVSLPVLIIDLSLEEFSNKDLNNLFRLICYAVSSCSGKATQILITVHMNQWHLWIKLFQASRFSRHIGVILKLSDSVELGLDLDRWLAEPVRGISLDVQSFTTNKKGFPVLAKSFQEVIYKFQSNEMEPKIFFSCGDLKHDYSMYSEYLKLVHKRYNDMIIGQRDAGTTPLLKDYNDRLQSPLQPLQHNLENETYEVFEQDPMKYLRYFQAIKKALQMIIQDQTRDADKHLRSINILIAGAGRGPLVKSAIKACSELKLASSKVEILALEKSPNAIHTIENLRSTFIDEAKSGVYVDGVDLWKGMRIIQADMRTAHDHPIASEFIGKIDLLVSELLGSFGDNELSPECIDGVQKMLAKDGISIPQHYKSYLAPISAPKIWDDIDTYQQVKVMETIYVVKLHAHFLIEESKECFCFSHPNVSHQDHRIKMNNERFKTLTFIARADAVIHGFAGYFTATLFKDIKISINPNENHESPGMFSWFPCFIPLRNPIFVSKGNEIKINIWRKVSRTKVWYEWALIQPHVSEIHNISGRSYTIGLEVDSDE